MRKLFPGFYDPTDEETSQLWQDGIFVFDTNMLLHVYRYSAETRDRFFETLSRLKERIWIPYQVAYEYQNNRLEVITDQIKAYDRAAKILDAALQKLKADLEQFKTRHSFIDPITLTADITTAFTKAKSQVQKAKRTHPDYRKEDPLRTMLEELFEGRIGEPYTKEKLEEEYQEAELRLQRLIPPGLEDIEKKGVRKYGDVIVWFQLIDYARIQKRPIIFITDDVKRDWWLTGEEYQGPLKPRPELVQEMYGEASVSFHMYKGYVFMEEAQNFLKLNDKPEVIQEIKEVSEESIVEREAESKASRGSEEYAAPGLASLISSAAAINEPYHQMMEGIVNSPSFQLANSIRNSPIFQLSDDITRGLNDSIQANIRASGIINEFAKLSENLTISFKNLAGFETYDSTLSNGTDKEEENSENEAKG